MLHSNLLNSHPNGDKCLDKGIDKRRIGVSIGSGGIGPLPDILIGHESLNKSYKKLSPYFVPKVLMNMSASHVSIKYGLQGPIHCTSTACASGLHSIGDAFNFIRLNYADIMVAGGTEACISPLAISGFSRMKALSTKNVNEMPSRPFDSFRDGFVIGEGSGVVVMEELSSAIRRGAPIIAEIVSYATNGDGFHVSSPAPALHGGGWRGMVSAVNDANIDPSEVGYINAHATSTPLGDLIESEAIDSVFQSDRIHPLYVSSTKGATGHLLGAAGSVETIFTLLALKHSIIPPTINLHNPEFKPSSFQYVQNTCRPSVDLNYAMKNSFGFGGVNGVLLMKKYTCSS